MGKKIKVTLEFNEGESECKNCIFSKKIGENQFKCNNEMLKLLGINCSDVNLSRITTKIKKTAI